MRGLASERLLWGVALLANRLYYQPIVSITGWLLGGGFAYVMYAALRDMWLKR